MIFKKLRISVAIALIIFILLVGSIIAFGVSKSPQTDLNAVPGNKKITLLNSSSTSTSSASQDTSGNTNSSSINSQSASGSGSALTTPVAPSSPVSTRVRTRAS